MRVRRTWVASVALAVAAGLGWAPAVAAPQPSYTFPDPTRDVTADRDAGFGGGFTPRIDPQAVDVTRVEVALTDTTVYARIDVRDFYGAGRVGGRQQGEQYFSFEMGFDNFPLMAGNVFFGVGHAPRAYASTHAVAFAWADPPQFDGGPCRHPASVATSPADDWVLLRLPVACATSPILEVDYLWGHAGQNLEQHDAGGRVLSRRLFRDWAQPARG
ncbi:hypothetical protein INN71_13865 [Nocardioides sp. ChNu-153]|uniref:hypothetical protein n=1 Tax=unclassified Nocardioides TaxID=2615069 RepID=UPI002406B3CD|nr:MULTISPECIES: hypothetical protein [unclassified Nocardioides]MDF9714929.1 hypothetical protein [Nocardioides sp. ChNu-99]MDN7122474.1 hypothetical protein [Nocardioides sp. ChNu-153]